MSQHALHCLKELPPTTLCHAAKTQCKYCTVMAFTCHCQSLSDEEAVKHSEGENSPLLSHKVSQGPQGMCRTALCVSSMLKGKFAFEFCTML